VSGDEMAFPFRVNGVDYGGVTKREYFAALAMQGLCANDTSASYDKGPCNAAIVARSVVLADALIAALNAEPQS